VVNQSQKNTGDRQKATNKTQEKSKTGQPEKSRPTKERRKNN
jgi:hypothetical protein